MPGLCRDCLGDAPVDGSRCPACGSPRVIHHPELDRLAIAHVDCDAFYAAIEKRDNPSLLDRPVIVGGGRRGVVATACYVARTFGVRSAMPMFRALELCPDAVVIRPDMEKYARVGREVRALMLQLTPLVEPISIDEAFLDLSGTEQLHGKSPAKSLAHFARRVETSLGITVSVGLSANKFLAKIASDLDKPRGFAVLGRTEAARFLAPRPVTTIVGVGAATQARLARDGYRTIADLQRADLRDLVRRYGSEGERLWQLAHGRDPRPVRPEREPKSVSAETTFDRDIADPNVLEQRLWLLCEHVSARLKAQDLCGATVTLKLKTSDFRVRTRTRSLHVPTRLARTIFTTARRLLRAEADGRRFRLIGVAISDLRNAAEADPAALLDAGERRQAAAEDAVDRVRAKFGRKVIVNGLVFGHCDDRE